MAHVDVADRFPTLSWPGKATPRAGSHAPPRLVECFEPDGPRTPVPDLQAWNRLFHGDNLPMLQTLAAAGEQFQLIYADPPYGSGTLWTRKVRLRGQPRELGRRVLARVPEYGDGLDDAGYLQFMYERLWVLRALLAPGGVLWLHADHRHSHHLRLIGDEIFGRAQWLNSITWRSQTARGAKSAAQYFPHSAHTLHIWTRDSRAPLVWNSPRRRIVLTEAEAAAEFMRDDRGFFRTSDPGSYTFESLKRLHAEGRLYAPFGGQIVIDDERRQVHCSHGGNLGVKYYLTDLGKGKHLLERAVDNIWDDIPGLGTTPGEDTGYPTQKTTALLERIITCATNPGDRVLDPFCGSGTTLVTAQRLGRCWVGIDAAPGAIRLTRARLCDTIGEQMREAALSGASGAPPVDQLRFALLHAEMPPAAGQSANADADIAQPADAQPADAQPADAQPADAQPADGFAGTAALEQQPTATLLITQNAFDPSRIQVTVTNYRAPALEALLDGGTVDWHALVESVAIDPAWDGATFRATLVDAPTRRSRTVSGSYEVHLPADADVARVVAVRLIDILGGEAIVSFDPAACAG
jgi:hypothetical protein